MKKLFLTGIAALFLATGTAHAGEIPKQYRGEWCLTKWGTIYRRCTQGDLIIDRLGWGGSSGDWACTILAVRNSRYGGHRLKADCHHINGREMRAEARRQNR